jgi:hypothetical protein
VLIFCGTADNRKALSREHKCATRFLIEVSSARTAWWTTLGVPGGSEIPLGILLKLIFSHARGGRRVENMVFVFAFQRRDGGGAQANRAAAAASYAGAGRLSSLCCRFDGRRSRPTGLPSTLVVKYQD